jgi:prophage maintenance system killer protein
LIFLEINNENLKASDQELVDLVLKTTAGQVGKREIAEFFRSHCA